MKTDGIMESLEKNRIGLRQVTHTKKEKEEEKRKPMRPSRQNNETYIRNNGPNTK